MTQKVKSLSKETGYALSMSQQKNENYSRGAIIFIHIVDVNVCLGAPNSPLR